MIGTTGDEMEQVSLMMWLVNKETYEDEMLRETEDFGLSLWTIEWFSKEILHTIFIMYWNFHFHIHKAKVTIFKNTRVPKAQILRYIMNLNKWLDTMSSFSFDYKCS